MLTLQQIITEVDTFVPNTFDNTKKLIWLNEINREFFELVKIPLVITASFVAGVATLPTDVRGRNVVRVQVENTFYLSQQYDQVNPGHNYWTNDDATRVMTLNPIPTGTKPGIVSYTKPSTKTFLVAAIGTDVPEAPEEYHWCYVLGLAERVAKAMNDTALANNYGNDYKSTLIIAQQNYGNRQKED